MYKKILQFKLFYWTFKKLMKENSAATIIAGVEFKVAKYMKSFVLKRRPKFVTDTRRITVFAEIVRYQGFHLRHCHVKEG